MSPLHRINLMEQVCFWLAAVFAGAGFGTDSLFGAVFSDSAVLLLLASILFDLGLDTAQRR